MNSIQRQARIAGLLYFLSSLLGPFCLVYVPNQLIVRGDAAATAAHVRASETLLRLGLGSELVGATLFIFVALALYRLFKHVSETQALAMLVLILVSIPIWFVDVLNEVAALILVSGAPFLSVFDPRQLDALVLLFMRLHGLGITVMAIFWGLWLFPFGILVIRSGFIPRVLGVLLILAGCSYPISSMTSLVVPQYLDAVSRFTSILQFGELPIIFWLLIWGARPQRATSN